MKKKTSFKFLKRCNLISHLVPSLPLTVRGETFCYELREVISLPLLNKQRENF